MTSVVARLIAKDIYLHRWLIGTALIGGVASLGVSCLDMNPGLGFGLVFYLTTVVAYGIVLVMHAVTTERNKKSLVFALSLPISPAEYLRAKMLAMLLAFVGPWGLLTIATMVLIAITPIPDGMIPYLSIVSLLMLMNFCVVLATTLVSTSDPIITLIIIATNASVSLLFILMAHVPSLAHLGGKDVITWPPAALEIMAVELVVALIAIALPFAMRRAGRGLFARA
jgi:ABC-type transport system involved in multi-copper enzyme maturation permease subunit